MFALGKGLFLRYKGAFLIYCLLFFCLACPFLLGDVVAPFRQYQDIKAIDIGEGSNFKENRKFSDCNYFYIPEITQNMKGSRSHWLSLWTNSNELGRPVYHLSGFSPAYLPSWILTQITNNPWKFYTILCLLNCFLAGIFIICFCREMSLNPIAGLIAGTSLANFPFLMYWLTFPMFSATYCWSAGVLWSMTRIAKKPDYLGWSILAFSIYSLLMTAFPQSIVFHAYLFAGYGIYLSYKIKKSGWHRTIQFVVLSASALIIGVVFSLPAYIDLANIAAKSARINCDPSFFTAVLPKVATIKQIGRFFVLSIFPQLFGNPIQQGYPFDFDGFHITPLIAFFSVIGLLTNFRKNWGWWMAIVLLCMLTFIQPLYVIAVKYFGLNLSRCVPLRITILPLIIITASGVDSLVKNYPDHKLSRIILIASAGITAVIIIGIIVSLIYNVKISWYMVLAMLILVALFLDQRTKTRLTSLIGALILVIVTMTSPLILRQNPDQIAKTSPLIEKMQTNLPKNSRYAIIAPGLPILFPNLNSVFGLDSIHSYNSLSPKYYHTLINRLGGDMVTYGRYNESILPDYNSAIFWMSNIGLVLSPNKLFDKNLEYLDEEAGIYFYKVTSRMGESLQIIPPQEYDLDSDLIDLKDVRMLQKHIPSKELDQADLLEFNVTPEKPSILVLSQKFHNYWQAQVRGEFGWIPAKTLIVNGVFQGVFLPQNVYQVRLEFKSYVCYAWIGHVFWIALFVFLIFKTWRRKGRFINTGTTI